MPDYITLLSAPKMNSKAYKGKEKFAPPPLKWLFDEFIKSSGFVNSSLVNSSLANNGIAKRTGY